MGFPKWGEKKEELGPQKSTSVGQYRKRDNSGKRISTQNTVIGVKNAGRKAGNVVRGVKNKLNTNVTSRSSGQNKVAKLRGGNKPKPMLQKIKRPSPGGNPPKREPTYEETPAYNTQYDVTSPDMDDMDKEVYRQNMAKKDFGNQPKFGMDSNTQSTVDSAGQNKVTTRTPGVRTGVPSETNQARPMATREGIRQDISDKKDEAATLDAMAKSDKKGRNRSKRKAARTQRIRRR
tara:strand:+ start:398 stop:1099 length:702 start_codon:yes stop_codon:yes gene_type:complete